MKKVGGGARKMGRNFETCARYDREHRRQKNKIRKWKKIIKKLPDNNRTCIDLKNKIKGLETKIIGLN